MLRRNKKGVSLMIAYVLLVSIAIGLAVGAFSWLKYYPNVLKPKENCKEGTTLVLEDYLCENSKLTLTLKNNGYFNISGFVLAVSNDTEREPINEEGLDSYKNAYEMPDGFYNFGTLSGLKPLKPGDSINVEISSNPIYLNKIVKIKIQPFIFGKDGKRRVVCENAVITQNLNNCFF